MWVRLCKEVFLASLQICLELCFNFLPAKAADVELLHRIFFLLGFGFELQFEPATDEPVVSAALRTGHCSCEKKFFLVPLVHKHMVKKMPIF